MSWHSELVGASVIAFLFLALFSGAELWRRFGKPKPETTRKLVHFGGGAISLGLVYVVKSHLTVLALCIVFFLIISVTKRYGLLQSVHGVERRSNGGIYFPIAVYVTFIFASYLRQPHYYLITILVLAVSDALAALVGKTYGFKLYRVERETRSVEGSIFFFLSSFLIVHLGLLLLTPLGRIESVLVALLIAILMTAFESISLGGADNLFIPLGTLFMLSQNTVKPAGSLLLQFVLLGGVAILTWVICNRYKKFGSTGMVGLILLGYASWAMVDYSWYIPILTGTLLIATTELIIETPKNSAEVHRIQPVFYIAFAAFAWIFGANRAEHSVRYLFLTPYLTSITCHLSILWQWKSKFKLFNSDCRIPKNICYSGTLGRALILTVIFIPIQWIVNNKLNLIFSLVTVFVGTILGDRLYWMIARRHLTNWERLSFLRMGLGVVFTVAILIFVANCWFYQASLIWIR